MSPLRETNFSIKSQELTMSLFSYSSAVHHTLISIKTTTMIKSDNKRLSHPGISWSLADQ